MHYWQNKFMLTLLLILSFSCASKKGAEYHFDKNLSQYDYPFNVSYFKLNSQNQNLKMAYGDIGPKKSSKVAILLHGKNFSGFYWEKIAKELVSKGYRVIIPDQIGFGKSSKPNYYQYSFQQMAANTFALLDKLKMQNFVLVGHSMGGMLATHMSSMSKRVSKLVLINPIGLEDYLEYVEYKDPEFFYKKELKKTVKDFRKYQRKNYYDGKWNESYEKLLTPFKGWRNSEDWKLIAWNNALTYGPIFTNPIKNHLKNLDIKLYLILGTRDRTGPGRAWKKQGVKRKLGQYQNLGREVKALNSSHIKLIELQELGHMPHFEDYSRFSKVFYPLF